MVHDIAPTDNRLLASPPPGSVVTTASWLGSRRGQQLILAIFVLNVISAILFVHIVNHPVYDDQYNLYDVHTYAAKGVSVPTILANKNPPGPTGFVWMAMTVRLLGGEELTDARMGALFSWIALVSVLFIAARFTEFPQLWYGALMASLLFPHSAESTALVLTEGPALLFAVIGALVWVEFMSRHKVALSGLLLGILGGFSMGLAVTCRQYFLALLPAALLAAILQARGRSLKENWRWYASVLLSLSGATLPVLLLVMIWKGLSSPGMATGTSYSNWKALVGFNLKRPVVAAFYTSLYLLPLTAFSAIRVGRFSRWRGLLGASCGLLAGFFSISILQPGPLRTAVHFVARGKFTTSLIVGVIMAVAVYQAAGVAAKLWKQRDAVLSRPPLTFAVLTVILFITEQVGVGGNIPFYDRYLLQMAPFLGLIAFAMFPRLTGIRLGVLAALFLISQVMLWRFAL